MKTVNLGHKSTDGKEYFSAVINKEKKEIEIFTGVSCTAHIYNHLQEKMNTKFRLSVQNIYSVMFLGDNIDLTRIPKKYSKFLIL